MPFPICKIGGLSQMDSLPVAVIKDYPLEKRDYKPYAQCCLCLDDAHLILRMWAFEVSPPEGSELKALLYLFPERPETALCVTMAPEERCAFSLCQGGDFTSLAPPPGFRLRPHSGEDLQGIYWGGLALLPLDWLSTLAGAPALEAENRFPGNVYKLCEGPQWAHQGSFFPADFPDNPYAPGSMGEFLVVSY